MKRNLKRICMLIVMLCLFVGITATEVRAATAKSGKLKTPEITLSNVVSTGKIKITWKEIADAVKYEVYRSTDGKNWKRLTTTYNTSVTNTSTTAGKKYYYKVRAIAFDTKQNSAFSTAKYRTCDLARPTISLANVSSSGKIKISWNAIDGAVKYEVYRSLDGKNWSRLVTTTKTSTTNISAVAGKKYYYKVRAIASNSAANSAYSTSKYRTCDLARPTVTLSVVKSTGKIKISWNAIDGAKNYKVYRSTDGKNWSRLITTTKTSTTNISAEGGKTYSYKVMAVSSNSAANSVYSTVKKETAGYPPFDAKDSVSIREVDGGIAVTYRQFPQSAADMQELVDEFGCEDERNVAAFFMASLVRFTESADDCFSMIDVLRGPQPLSSAQKSQIKDSLSDKKYLPRTYFEGAIPKNEYKPDDPWTVVVYDDPVSAPEGYAYVMVKSGGADSKRRIVMRTKDDQSYLWEYYGVLLSVRLPASEDPWL